MPRITGPLKVDRRTKDLVKRLRPGDIAFIHHADLDATAARSLADLRPAAVVNAGRSITGRYPNRGPAVLLEAGVPLFDIENEALFETALQNGIKTAVIDENALRLGNGDGGPLSCWTAESVKSSLLQARRNLSSELEGFARNTLEYMEAEKGILIDPVDVPELRTPIAGKHVLVVVRGEGYKQDLQMIGPYISDNRPVLIGVDGGADALLELGLRPHIIIGDMDSVSDRALKCGAELIVHGYSKGDRSAPGLERINALGLTATVFHTPGTSEDIAMLIADERGASLIAAVGTHFSLEEFLDKGRRGMASTFLVRLRIGAKLVDAKGIARLYSRINRPATKELIFVSLAALVPVAAIVLFSPWFRTILRTARLSLRSAFGF